MTRTVAQKMGVKPLSKAYFLNADDVVLENIQLPELKILNQPTHKLDYIHFFVKTQQEFKTHFPKLKANLNEGGMLWVSWPKAKKLGTDLNIKIVIKLGYDYGLVESTCLSVNEIWSGLKFTHPKKGKIYKNSYGNLNQETS